MPFPKVSTAFMATLFSIAGLVLGFCSLGYLEVVFYTTKPFFFLEAWHVYLFIALFTISFALIPFTAAHSQHGRLIWFLIAWICVTVLTAFLVSVITAIIHHLTLGIPYWLIPVGLLLIPIVSGVMMLLLARFWRLKHETCA
jgi:hypothetical protein